MTLVYNSLPHHTSVVGVFFCYLFCVITIVVYLCTQIIQKRKKIIMIREPIIIDNPSPKALEVIERMKEEKRRDVHSRKHISLARLERESMTVNESEQKLTDVIHRQYNRL